MPELDFLCQTDGPYRAYRSVHAPDGFVPDCPTCHTPGETDWSGWQRQNVSSATPIVVFEGPDGEMRFPGSATGASAANYERLGYKRIEIRGWADARRFEGRVNKDEMRKIERRVERQQQAMEQHERVRRSDFFNGMRNGFQIPVQDEKGNRTGQMKTVHLSARNKDVAEHLIRNGNARKVRGYEPGFRIDVYSDDRSNREPGRDGQGRRMRD